MSSKIPWNYTGKCPKLPWMIDFHSTDDGKILNDQFKSSFARNRLQHLIDLNPRSKIRPQRLTQLICEIPKHSTRDMITNLLRLEMSAALVSTFKSTIEECTNLIRIIKETCELFEIEQGYHYSLAILLDIARPQITTGHLSKSVELVEGSKVKVTSNPLFENRCSKDFIYVNYQNIADVIKPGDSLVLGGGEINLSALHIVQEIIECIVAKAGSLMSSQSVSIPNTPIDLEMTTPSFSEDFARLSLELSLDGIITSYKNINTTRKLIGETILILAKIDTNQIFDEIDSILHNSDGIYLDSEKLLVTLKEKLFLAQKSISARCNKEGKPMILQIGKNSSPRTFINDLANGIIDGCDCVLVPYDLELIELVNSTCKAAENAIHQKQILEDLTGDLCVPLEPIYSIALSAVELSFRSNASAIIMMTTTGRCTRLLAKFRPKCPILAITRYHRIARQLHLHKAIVPLYISKAWVGDWNEDVEKRAQYGITFGKMKGLIKMGDALVIVSGVRPGSGFTNNVKVVFASEYDTIDNSVRVIPSK